MCDVNKFVKGCKRSVDVVDKIKRTNNVVLSPNEKLDYYFKVLVNYRTDMKMLLKSKKYRLAKFYQVCYDAIVFVQKEGYTNDIACSIFTRINRYAKLCLHKGSSYIDGYDMNGKYIISMDDLEDIRYECEWIITDKDDLCNTIISVAEYYVKCSEKYSEFDCNYFSTIMDVMLNDEEVTPYTDLSKNQTLAYNLTKNNIIGNVVQFKNIGGVANERNRRDVSFG